VTRAATDLCTMELLGASFSQPGSISPAFSIFCQELAPMLQHPLPNHQLQHGLGARPTIALVKGNVLVVLLFPLSGELRNDLS